MDATGGAARARRVVRNLPLAVSGALRRFSTDPARGRAALERAVPALRGAAPHEADSLVRFDRAVAEDRYEDARRLLEEIPPAAEDRADAELALARIAGDLSLVENARPDGRRGQRARRVAAEQASQLLSALPTWAFHHVDPTGASAHTPARVLHVVTNSLPLTQAGSTIRTHRVAAAQREDHWDARVVTRPGYPVVRGQLDSRPFEVFDAVPYARLLPGLAPSAGQEADCYRRMLEQLVRRWRPDVLHAASDHVNARAALEVGRTMGIPVAYEVRSFHEDTWLSRHPGCGDSDTYRWTKDRHTDVMLAADVVTTLGQAMREEILSRGVDPARVVITPNAVTEDYLQPRDWDAARDRLGLEQEPQAFWVGTVATLAEAEGLDTVIDAAASLRAGGLDARLLLVGDGPARRRLCALAAERGVPLVAPGRVPVSAVRDYYDALDVFALPRSDNALNRRVTALKPLEAQARGVPVVGSDLPAVAEVLAPGMPRIPAGDHEALAVALAALADPGERSRLGDLGHSWVASCRTWPSVTTLYRSAYASVGVAPRH